MKLFMIHKDSPEWQGLSPHYMGPIYTVEGRRSPTLQIAWDYLHVYPEHIGALGEPSEDWFNWSNAGFEEKAPPIPTSKPLGIYLEGRIEDPEWARRYWWTPHYVRLAYRTAAWTELSHQWFLHFRDGEIDDKNEYTKTILLKMLENE